MNTTAPKFSPDDPRLTAYALGELDDAERTEIEALLRDDPAAQATVDSIRTTAAQLEAALALEPLPVVVEPSAEDPYRARRGKLLRFPRFYYMAATLAAACFAVLVAFYRPEPKPVAYPTKARQMAMPAATATAAASEDAADELDTDAVATNQPSKAKTEALWRQLNEEAMNRLKDGNQPVKLQGNHLGLNDTAGSSSGKAALRVAAGWESRPVSFGLIAGASPALRPLGPNTESYAYQAETGFIRVADHPLSTFSADVDTASYANVRRFIEEGKRPPAAAVRIEEMLNYFPYHYAAPTGDQPFAASLEVAAAPWAPEHRLVRIGLQGREITVAARPPANLVFLLDVSGSMTPPNKLPLVKTSLRLLLERLRPDDRVAIVTYAGNSGLALPSTPVSHAAEIREALESLRPGGSTNGAMGIQLAYDIAKANLVPGGINRVILCTDGDFNVGVTSEGELTRLIQEKAKSGVFLSVLGFGMGNYKDSMLEQLADKGNGNYGYIDSRREAEKLLAEQVNSTLVTIAKDVKLQVEFNPAQVAAYRLIGYENRRLQKEDFNNDKVDAGEMGAGHAVTALYEIIPVGAQVEAPRVDRLRYQPIQVPPVALTLPHVNELLALKVRYKAPDGETSRMLEFPLTDHDETFAAASPDFKFAAAVAGFGLLLTDSQFKGTTTLPAVEAWAQAGLGNDAGGYRSEFLDLVKRAKAVLP